MKTQLTRRALIATAPAALCLSAAAHASPALLDPFLAPYRQWVEARAEWRRLTDLHPNYNENGPNEVLEAATAEDEAFEQMAKIIPTSTEGLAALVAVMWVWHGPDWHRDSLEYQEALMHPDNRMFVNLHHALSGSPDIIAV